MVRLSEVLEKELSRSVIHGLNLCDIPISSDEIHLVADAILKKKFLSLNLNNCGLDERCIELLAPALAQCGLEGLQLRMNRLSDRSLQCILGALDVGSPLMVLDLGRNPISDDSAHAIAHILRTSNCIDTVRLDWTKLGNPGALRMALALPSSAVNSLDLSNTRIGRSGMRSLARHSTSRPDLSVVGLPGFSEARAYFSKNSAVSSLFSR